MNAKVLGVFIFVNILANGVLSSPPLQLEPQIGDFPDRVINVGKRGLKDSSILARLPGDVIPSFYSVDITPILDPEDEANFLKAPGRVIITVECVKVTTAIVLNINEITIGAVKVRIFKT